MDTESADFEEIVLSAWVLFWSRATEAIDIPHWEALPRCARMGFRDACREVLEKAPRQEPTLKPEECGTFKLAAHLYEHNRTTCMCDVCGRPPSDARHFVKIKSE
jgi:hypothetical protein